MPVMQVGCLPLCFSAHQCNIRSSPCSKYDMKAIRGARGEIAGPKTEAGDIYDALVFFSSRRVGDARLDRVVGKSRIVASVMEDGRVGVVMSAESLGPLPPVGGIPASEASRYLLSRSPEERSIGLSCINALCNTRRKDDVVGDVTVALGLGPESKVVMIGDFVSLARRILPMVASLDVFDFNACPQRGVRPAAEAFERIPTCDVLLITATTIINKTLMPLLQAATSCREVALVGATTPMIPEAFKGTPLTLLSGVVVEEPGLLLSAVAEGSGMQGFKRYVTKLSRRI